MKEKIDYPDENTAVLYLEVPAAKVILFQAVFEMYEGVAVVRTVDLQRSLVCVLSTPSMIDECVRVLEAIREETGWRYASPPSPEERARYLDYFGRPS